MLPRWESARNREISAAAPWILVFTWPIMPGKASSADENSEAGLNSMVRRRRSGKQMGLAMKKTKLGAVVSLALLLALSANARAQRVPPDVVVSHPQVYEVTITTTFFVPKNGKMLNALRVWHALPTARPWDGLDRTLGASEISYQPENGQVKQIAHNESQHVYWEFREGLKPGKKFELVSRFRVRSADRTYDCQSSKSKWSDYQYAGVLDQRPQSAESWQTWSTEFGRAILRPKRRSSSANGSPNISSTMRLCPMIRATLPRYHNRGKAIAAIR